MKGLLFRSFLILNGIFFLIYPNISEILYNIPSSENLTHKLPYLLRLQNSNNETIHFISSKHSTNNNFLKLPFDALKDKSISTLLKTKILSFNTYKTPQHHRELRY